jgi:hypothetical protein
MKSDQLSNELRNRGFDLSPETVRTWWAKGAPRDDVEEFLEFYHANRASWKSKPRCEPKDPAWKLIKAIDGILSKRFHEFYDLANDTIAYVDEKAEAAGAQTVTDPTDRYLALTAIGLKKTLHTLQVTGAFCSVLEYYKREGKMSYSRRAEVEKVLRGEGFDFESALREIGIEPGELTIPAKAEAVVPKVGKSGRI